MKGMKSMKNRSWIAMTVAVGMLSVFPFTAVGESNEGLKIDIKINGVPIGDVIGTASGMLADAVEENVGEAVEGLDGVFSEFAQGFSESLSEIEDTVDSMIKAPADEAEVNYDYFCYSNSGSSTYEIYSYEVVKDEETGEWKVVCELHCGYETYTLPADDALMQQLQSLIDQHQLRNWDGFHETDSNVLDGYGFGLTIAFTDGSVVSASGSNSFPDGFSESKRVIDELFIGYLNANGIEPEM